MTMVQTIAATVPLGEREFVTVTVAGQRFGIPVPSVRDVLAPHRVAPIPLARSVIAGAINLRGRIVTVIDLRVALGLPAQEDPSAGLSVVVEGPDEPYALLVDGVGEVLSRPAADILPDPPHLDARWHGLSAGIIRLDRDLLVILDLPALFAPALRDAA